MKWVINVDKRITCVIYCKCEKLNFLFCIEILMHRVKICEITCLVIHWFPEADLFYDTKRNDR